MDRNRVPELTESVVLATDYMEALNHATENITGVMYAYHRVFLLGNMQP